MILYQKARTGKIKFIELWTEGEFLCSKWGTVGSKEQETRKECEGKNIGKANESTPAEQAIFEMEAKIVKKKKNGYVESLEEAEAVDSGVDVIDLDNLPTSFCPSKPAKTAPTKIMKDDTLFGQLKRNGHCLILVKTEKSEYVYSRGMEPRSYLKEIPEIRAELDGMSTGSMIFTEFCCVQADGTDSPRKAGEVSRQSNVEKAVERYNKLKKENTFEVVPFDIMYYNGVFCGDTCYKNSRYPIMQKMGLNVPPMIENWEEFYEQNKGKKRSKIEGLVLRVEGEQSYIRFTLNGKADKCGAWKLKYVHEDDFIVTSAVKGKAGRQAGLYSQFFISQYVDGELVNFGKCGPGKLKHDQLKELTDSIDNGELQYPFVIEIEYQSRQEDSGCCEFPQFTRVRYDKKPEECVKEF